jgi:hypothetical protein
MTSGVPLTYVLIADGTSDRALDAVIRWAIRHKAHDALIGETRFVRRSQDIEATIAAAVKSYEPNLVFVHRDAEGLSWEIRRREIPAIESVVAVIPVRMTEAWLLIDEQALRKAAGNPNGRERLDMPRPQSLEGLSDPKARLQELLVTASGLSGRRRKSFRFPDARARLAFLIEDFGVLLGLPAFQCFLRELGTALTSLASKQSSSGR